MIAATSVIVGNKSRSGILPLLLGHTRPGVFLVAVPIGN